VSDLSDVVRLAVLVVVVIDPIAATIGAADLATDRPARDRATIALGGGVVAFAVLTVAAVLADPLLDALDLSPPAAQLAAGIVIMVPALDLLWQGPAERVAAAPRAAVARLAVFPFGVPVVAGPAALAAVVAWAAAEGTGVTIAATALATAAIAVLAVVWRRPPRGRGARVLGGFVAVAMAIIAFDLVRDGVLGA
jgi:multiple antibiotic resistance protein